ncbi:MAG: hypothetical protein WC421_10765 [Elusimicrobiales bacterium]
MRTRTVFFSILLICSGIAAVSAKTDADLIKEHAVAVMQLRNVQIQEVNALREKLRGKDKAEVLKSLEDLTLSHAKAVESLRVQQRKELAEFRKAGQAKPKTMREKNTVKKVVTGKI